MLYRGGTVLLLSVLVGLGTASSRADAGNLDPAGPSTDAPASGSNVHPAMVVDRASIAGARVGDVLTLNLPDGGAMARVNWRQDHAEGRFVIAGALDGAGTFSIASNRKALYGHVRRPGRLTLTFRTDAELGTVFGESAEAQPYCEVDHQRFAPVPPPSGVGSDGNCDDGTVIDVLVVYTPVAVAWVGGVAEIEAAIDLAIAENNIAWADSGLARRQRLVLTWQVFENGDIDCLIDPTDGCLDEVPVLRDLYGADLVALVPDGFGGFADGLETLDPSEEATAYCIARVRSFDDAVLSHELGHLMGCCHALGDGGGCDVGLLFPYSNGHRFVGDSGTEWRTVMAYPPGTKILRFSNPAVDYDGQPTGVHRSEPGGADNVATIDASAFLVSNFRCQGVCGGSDQPSDGPDCNDNRIPDACDIASGTSNDRNGNGAPDECEQGCPPGSLVVSTDPADGAGFATIQQAVDSAAMPRTCIKIYPGLTGTYPESVIIDRSLALAFVGVDLGWGPPVVESSTGPAFDIVSTRNSDPVRIRNLMLRGETGIRTAAPTVLENLVFAGAPSMLLALDLNGGPCTASDLRMGASVVDGIDLAAGHTLVLDRASLVELGGTGIRIAGEAALTNVLIGGADVGISISSTGELALDYSTVASSGAGAGVDNSNGGLVSVYMSILHDNLSGDALGVSCSSISRSVVSSPDCSGMNGNTAENPQLDADYEPLGFGSAIDLGPDPSTFTGEPCLDALGRPRLRDGDSDRLSRADAGALENDSKPVNAVVNLRWTGPDVFDWDGVFLATEYRVYRADSATLGYDDFGTCIDGSDPDRTDRMFQDSAVPPPGNVFFYRVTAVGNTGFEHSLGWATCVERSTFSKCTP